ncbi:alpha/beta hydrolase [Pseudotabrizicola sp.]|uniref:alpha/beta hydrolase n=1 Tax=Pseudotabrizicola sp. TaxID=2939647 RepID=UPI002727DC5E|nr:alpha/beta hydrolase [Pseudotabrizicola sp.]MDO8882985.1 alpha/beta hydrolase [Pseudotabrizicola sp.]
MDFASEADRAYANGAFIPGADGFVPRWRAEAAAYRGRARAQLGLGYGPGARRRFDLFAPEGAPRGLMVFVHGGYWMAFDREDWSHLAAGAVARGWACAVPSYTLAPEARISAMTDEVAAAVRAAADLVPGPVVVAGHSAGGHLAARMACEDVQSRGGPKVARVVPISPIADLRPLMATEMNATLRLDDAEAVAQSPALLRPRAGVQAHVWVGGQERPAFLWQARLLSEEWNCPWTVDAGRHHFDVMDGLTDPGSPLMDACLGGL